MKHQREWPKHKAWIENRPCALIWNMRAGACMGDVVACHVRTGTDGGGSLKPSQWWTIPMCVEHHWQQTHIGEAAFERVCGIDMKAMARDYAARSPDKAMIASMKESQP